MGRYTEDFEEIERLGKGGFGQVYKCKHQLDTTFHAVKKIPFNDGNKATFLWEVRLLAMLQHHRVICYRQSWIEDGVPDGSSSSEGDMSFEGEMSNKDERKTPTKTLFVSMEVCTSMHTLIPKGMSLEQKVVMRYTEELLEGLAFIHGAGVIHGDITRDNVFVDAHGHIKFGDFGLARLIREGATAINSGSSPFGKPIYLAPELSPDDLYRTEKSDVFAVGLLIFEMSHAMDTDSEREAEFKELKRTGDVPEAGDLAAVRPILLELLITDPQERSSAAHVLSKFFCGPT